jgi:hypothetical protein
MNSKISVFYKNKENFFGEMYNLISTPQGLIKKSLKPYLESLFQAIGFLQYKNEFSKFRIERTKKKDYDLVVSSKYYYKDSK